jgi:hypothetical protein
MDISAAAGVSGVTAICYLMGLAVKLSPLPDRWIPLCCGLLGAGLGLAALALMPGYPADNPIDAAALGIAAGLAATGWDQMGRQLRP